MLYEPDLTIPANTSKANRVSVDGSLVPGIIEQGEIHIPFGWRGLVHTRALRGAFPLFPTGPDQSFKADGSPIRWDEHYELRDEPLTITLEGWSPDTVFQHIITWRFALREFTPGEFPVREKAGVKRRLLSAFGG